jgi:hypothetical protein
MKATAHKGRFGEAAIIATRPQTRQRPEFAAGTRVNEDAGPEGPGVETTELPMDRRAD